MKHRSLYTRQYRWRRRFHTLLDWLFPTDDQNCLLCRRPFPQIELDFDEHTSPRGVCLFCLQNAIQQKHLPKRKRLRLTPADVDKARGASVAIDVVSGTVYDGLVRDAIRQWKYDGTIGFTNWFSHLVYQGMKRDLGFQFDVMVPVPTSTDRLRKRGYHHVGLLAEAVSGLNQIPVEDWLLRRAGNQNFTQSQTVRNATERRNSLVGAFTLTPGAQVQGKRVLLLDDIVTTGATLHTCASVLFEAGAEMVACAVIAHVM